MGWRKGADQGYPDLVDGGGGEGGHLVEGGEGGHLVEGGEGGHLVEGGEGGHDHGSQGGLREGGRAPGVRRLWKENPRQVSFKGETFFIIIAFLKETLLWSRRFKYLQV